MWIFRICLLLAVSYLRADESPEELINDSTCNAENSTEFYLQIRDMQSRERRYPTWPNGDTGLAGLEIFWGTLKPYRDILPSYEDFWLDAFSVNVSTINPGIYTWCVYVFTKENDIHGCVRDGEAWGTPKFRTLGLLEKLSTRDVGLELKLPFALMSLTIDTIGSQLTENLLWHNSMVTLNIDWVDPTSAVSPVGEYLILNVQTRREQYITDISRQEESFLVEGAQNKFFCDTHGIYRLYLNSWRLEGSTDTLYSVEAIPCDIKDRNPPCEDIRYYNYFFDTDNCERSGNSRVIGTNRMTLEFSNASRDDTGEYVCVIGERLVGDLQTRSIFLYVVFIEVFELVLPYNQKGEMGCVVKAPTGSEVTVWHDEDRLTENSDPNTCNDSAWISTSSEVLDAQFSMFYVTIHICRVSVDNVGKYACEVRYSIPTESKKQLARKETEVTIIETAMEDVDPGMSEGAGIAIACSTFVLAIVLIVTVTLALSLTVIKISRHRARKRNSKRHINFEISPVNDLYHKVPSVSPGCVSVESDCMEFSRNNLDLHRQIGKGRFGKVMLATARNIVPHLPTLNKVAVKMALTNTSNEMMHYELKLMKKLDSHGNICNLLAYCSIDGPVYIIVEYADHGNLKDYLDSCRQTLRQSGKAPFISTASSSVGDGLHAGPEEKMPGYISESDIKHYAFQIASGLEHLENMQVIHCDLAARNILISEGFVLKIGDFGMAKSVSDEETYHHSDTSDLHDVVAIKWAALEVLENKGYVFRSDVWSYGVIIWEVASYGARPFSKHKVGVTLSKFIDFLRAGHRLPQPDGLSDSIYQTLLNCWSLEPSTRPSSSDLKLCFQDQR